MTMPTKGSRKIEVDGRHYMWRIRKVGESLSLTIQDQETNELILRKVHLNEEAPKTVSPADVRKIILAHMRRVNG
jgi:hypothetical protein